MGIEIERKFLVVGDAWRSTVQRSTRMAQGYLNDAQALAEGREHCSVRVRIAGEQAYLNIKSREIGPSRQEFEYPLPPADAQALLELCSGGLIDKIRHYVQVGAHLWEVDEFLGDNSGLVVAEIELSTVDEAFERPDWAGREVTEHARYYNLALAEHPYTRWTELEKS
jgi:adenylate cyclase